MPLKRLPPRGRQPPKAAAARRAPRRTDYRFSCRRSSSSHYLFELVACTPASGWEKGQVENQVDLVRSRFFALRRRFTDLEELNEWLERECRNYAASAKHPVF